MSEAYVPCFGRHRYAAVRGGERCVRCGHRAGPPLGANLERMGNAVDPFAPSGPAEQRGAPTQDALQVVDSGYTEADVPDKAADVGPWINAGPDVTARAEAALEVERNRDGGTRQTVLAAVSKALGTDLIGD